MPKDHLVRGIFPAAGLRAIFARVGDTARMARMLHGLAPTAAHLFAEGICGGLMLAALQKDRERINLQLECDGPIRGLLVDANPAGEVRGYVRGPAVHFPGDPVQGARAALGGAGYLSVVRDQGKGQFYRGSVELQELRLAGDLRRYFAESEQVDTALDLRVEARGQEPLGDVAGLLLQRLPGGDAEALQAVRGRIEEGGFARAVAEGSSAQEALRRLGGEGFELLADQEVAYVCGCSQERARAAVSVLGREGVEGLLAEDRKAVVACEFCRAQYLVGEEELRSILARLSGPAG